MASDNLKEFDVVEANLRKKYILAECLMIDPGSASELKKLVSVIDDLYQRLLSLASEAFTPEELNSEGHQPLKGIVQCKVEFDTRIGDWFQINDALSDKSAISPKSPDRLYTISDSASSLRSSRSSVKRREAYVRAQKARLEVLQVDQREKEKVAAAQEAAERKAEEARRESIRNAEMAELELRAWNEQCTNEQSPNLLTMPNSSHEQTDTVGNPNITDNRKHISTRILNETSKNVLPVPFSTFDKLSVNCNRFESISQPNPAQQEYKPEARASPRYDGKNRVQRTVSPERYEQIHYWGDRTLPPRPELMKFNGDPLDYHEFIRNFETHVMAHVRSDSARLTYLLQQCEPDVRRQLSHFSKDPVGGYNLAREQLWQLYGRPHIISAACAKLLSKTPEVGERDPSGLLKLNILLQRCRSALADVGEYAGFNSLHCLLPILQKLPDNLQAKWIEWSVIVFEENKREAGFLDLVTFVSRHSNIWNSLYGESLYRRADNVKMGSRGGRKLRVATCSTVSETKPHVLPNSQGEMCILCFKRHSLSQCNTFRSKRTRERREYALNKGLCFRCLCHGHRVIDCSSTEECGECGSPYHHTMLHAGITNDKKVTNNETPIKHTMSCSSMLSEKLGNDEAFEPQDIYLCVVPVKVRFQGREVCTYAFLDTGSTATFCSQTLVNALGLTGVRKQIQMTTLCNQSSYNGMITNFTVCSLDANTEIHLRNVVSVDQIPVQPNVIPDKKKINDMSHLKGLEFPHVAGGTVTLLIGIDVPEALCVERILKGKRDEPVAWKTPLGWSLMGPSCVSPRSTTIYNNLAAISTDRLSRQINRLWEMDFGDATAVLENPTSREDRVAHDMMKRSIVQVDGHFQLALPRKPGAPDLPDNRAMAEKRIEGLKRRLQKDDDLRKKYMASMQTYIDNDYAREVTTNELNASNYRWFIPHHPVMHPRKPGKVRVVFDCAAKHKGLALNDVLLQGPDLMNSLVGVLMRFRIHQVALVADVEAMFHQVRVEPKDRKTLSFLWWKDGNLESKPLVHEMLVHLFGATSSPSCAAFCLRQTAIEFGHLYDDVVSEVVTNNFYVDDCLVSARDVNEAVRLGAQLRDLLSQAGFRLTKWLTNNQQVLDSIPEQDRAKNVKTMKIDDCVDERVLGVQWLVSCDKFTYTVVKKKSPVTKRGILSVVSSIYDPLGFAAPVLIKGRLLWQKLCKRGLDWDEPVLQSEADEWKSWLDVLPGLEDVRISRCFRPPEFGNVAITELHHFADASTAAYSAVSYLRSTDDNGNVHCAFLFGKARVAPTSTMSVPRLELTAAVLAVRNDQVARRELKLSDCQSTFWTDSTAVLQTLFNSTKRFPTFVANRIAEIERHTDIKRWKHVPTQLNPADDATRGLDPDALSGRWLNGPQFLWSTEDTWPKCPVTLPEVPDEFLPVKRQDVSVNLLIPGQTAMNQTEPAVDRLINYYSSWYRLKKAAAWLLRYKEYLRQRVNQDREAVSSGPLTVEEMKFAGLQLIKYEQRKHFGPIIASLMTGQQAKKNECTRALLRLNPFIKENLLRVGGRIERATVEYDIKHPIILPCHSKITELVITEHHELVGHSGSGHTISSLRRTYWILKIGVAVRRVLTRCLPCERRRTTPSSQMMADLPACRLQSDKPAFSSVGIDYFGPFYVKQGRSQIKRYGCLFTCLTMRAVHLEVACDLSTDSFLNALRRFTGRRGKPEHIYSDNGTNFVGAAKILRSSIKKWNHQHIAEHLRQKEISWSFNPPAASHMGGAWERIIRSVRRVLSSLQSPKTVLTDETLQTLFVEVESILNSRPLVPVTIDVRNDEVLTPNHLLILRGSPNQAPGLFDDKDCYARRRWAHVQHLANVFWKRWLSDFLPHLIERQKWVQKRSNIQNDDIVLLVDESQPRAKWTLGRVVDTYADKHGAVRTVSVKTKNGVFKRPIAKLCLIAQKMP